MRRGDRWRSRVRIVLAVAPVALLVAAMASAQQGRGAGAGRGGAASNFTGQVAVQDSSEMRMSRIRFEAGARTNWHVHSTSQMLLIEEGRGRLQEQGRAIQELPAGQPVYTQANVPHWHGAAPDEAAVQFTTYSGTLEWRAPVTDEEYLGTK